MILQGFACSAGGSEFPTETLKLTTDLGVSENRGT